jgi:hypothetical protein
MITKLQPARSTVFLCLALALASGCKSTPAPTKTTTPSTAQTSPVMDETARANAAKLAAAHPPFKLFLQKIDMPTILVVPETTTDDQLKSLLWYLRTKVRSGQFKDLGLQPTASLFDRAGYSSGVLNIYRGPRCAREMYLTTNPCGASIHRSASYHWGEGGNRQADGADYVTQSGTEVQLFDATDGWQTDAEAATDPDGTKARQSAARIKYSLTETARQVRQRTDIRFSVDVPTDELDVISYQFATDQGQKTFLNELLTLNRDQLCTLGFKTVSLGVRGAPGRPYPIDCPTPK